MAVSRHFAIVAPPTPGHMNPLQALASELIKLGHRTTFVHQADVVRLIGDQQVGFEALPVPVQEGLSLAQYNTVLGAPTGVAGFTRMIRTTAKMSEWMLRHGPAALRRIGADAVIADSAEPAGELVAQHLDIPYVTSVTGLPLLGEVNVPPPYLGWRFRGDTIGRLRNRGGYAVANQLLRPITRMLKRYQVAWDLTGYNPGPRLYVAQSPRGLDYPRESLPADFHYGGPWRLPSLTEISLPDDGRPLVFCSLGTLQGSRANLFATMSEACALIGARAIIGHAGGLSSVEAAALPGDPLVRAFWPQESVLRRCTAAILHGGFNTVLDSLAAAVPIVAMPIAFEQPGTAARLLWSGAGEVMPARSASVDRLGRILKRVMIDPRYRHHASRLSMEMQAVGGAASAAARINDFFGNSVTQHEPQRQNS